MAFEPDLFSASCPEWQPVGPEANAKVLALVAKHYRTLGSELTLPLQIGSQEVNSNNFRIQIGQNNWVLKRWNPSWDVGRIKSTCNLLSLVAAKGSPVAPPQKNDSGELVVSIDGRHWALFPCIPGNYYSGCEFELESAGFEIGKLFDVLAKVPKGIVTTAAPDQLTDRDDTALVDVFRTKASWMRKLGETNAVLLERHEHQLRTIWRRLRASPPWGGNLQLSHYDIHPHNLLVNDGKIATILDFDACQYQAPGYGLAFSALKLVRQAIVAEPNGSSPSDRYARYSEGILSAFGDAATILPGFRELAQAEVLRRVCRILRCSFEEANPAWNHVLPVQLRHLDEIEYIFTNGQDAPVYG